MSIIDKYKKNHSDNVKKNSLYLYQIQEHDGEIWMTYNGFLICPCAMLKDEPVAALQKMRELYIQRNG